MVGAQCLFVVRKEGAVPNPPNGMSTEPRLDDSTFDRVGSFANSSWQCLTQSLPGDPDIH